MQNNTAIKTEFSELKFLDKVLQDNSNDMNLIKAHGFLTALASFPNTHKPQDWLPILVGDLKSMQPAINQTVANGLTNLYQKISLSLYSDQEFKFLLSVDYPALQLRQVRYSNIQEWCGGYCLALIWQDQQWLHQDQEYITNACATFFVVADILGSQEIENKSLLIETLPEIVKSLFLYWHGSQYAGQPLNIRKLH